MLLCLVGAGLTLIAVGRTWALEVTDRPGALPDLRQARTGAAILAWLPPLAVVGLAGAGALLATRGLVRRLLGLLLLVSGAAVAAGAGFALVAVDRGAAGPAAVGWPLLCLAGGLLAGAGAALAAARGHTWPAMGARYERPTRGRDARGDGGAGDRGGVDAGAGADGAVAGPGGAGAGPGGAGAGAVDAGAGAVGAGAGGRDRGGAGYERGRETGRVDPAGPVDTREAWEALDRGEDPTDT
ncbi:MAG TPA: Trp biosynthesis-associated membrane protein [Catenuloplanes sp.]